MSKITTPLDNYIQDHQLPDTDYVRSVVLEYEKGFITLGTAINYLKERYNE